MTLGVVPVRLGAVVIDLSPRPARVTGPIAGGLGWPRLPTCLLVGVPIGHGARRPSSYVSDLVPVTMDSAAYSAPAGAPRARKTRPQ